MTGFEPSTFVLDGRCSTAELTPQATICYAIFLKRASPSFTTSRFFSTVRPSPMVALVTEHFDAERGDVDTNGNFAPSPSAITCEAGGNKSSPESDDWSVCRVYHSVGVQTPPLPWGLQNGLRKRTPAPVTGRVQPPSPVPFLEAACVAIARAASVLL